MSKKSYFRISKFFIDIIILLMGFLNFIKIYWILHNVDKESDDNYRFLIKLEENF